MLKMSKQRWLRSDSIPLADSSAAQRLLEWYAECGRDLPWRRTHDPYAIWVSEVMLQQTQVKTVLPYFDRWMARFPDVAALAAASEQDILDAWQGLGYYRRVRSLWEGAKTLSQSPEVRGQMAQGKSREVSWPASRAEWRLLPGVGEYTSAAIASIALGERVAVVDGNVERVYARINADDSADVHRAAWKWAQAWMDSAGQIERVGDFNQALMELGATVCTPREPGCSSCPIQRYCRGFELGITGELPRSAVKPTVLRVTRYVAAYQDGESVALQKIPAGEWWEGLWTLPPVASLPEDYRMLGTVKHTVTNHRITMYVLGVGECPAGARMFPLEALPPLPSPQRKAIQAIRGS
jgi:A/G-specific adenine glycosylase